MKSRVNHDVLSVRFASGRAKRGLEFADMNAFSEYIEVVPGVCESLLFPKIGMFAHHISGDIVIRGGARIGHIQSRSQI